jgi:hypothetical protein
LISCHCEMFSSSSFESFSWHIILFLLDFPECLLEVRAMVNIEYGR